MPEWADERQLLLLGQSCLLGVALGFVFDVFNVPSKARRKRRRMIFLLDILFFVVAALVTFFFSLVMMDGRMHPLIFCGSVCGFVVQHLTVGRVFSRLLYDVFRLPYGLFRWISRRALAPIFRKFCSLLLLGSRLRVKTTENAEKSQKKSGFFQKNS